VYLTCSKKLTGSQLSLPHGSLVHHTEFSPPHRMTFLQYTHKSDIWKYLTSPVVSSNTAFFLIPSDCMHLRSVCGRHCTCYNCLWMYVYTYMPTYPYQIPLAKNSRYELNIYLFVLCMYELNSCHRVFVVNHKMSLTEYFSFPFSCSNVL